MESEALKNDIRKTYVPEYACAQPLTRRQKWFAFPAGILLGASPWAIAGGAIAGVCGVAAAPAIFVGGVVAAAAGFGLLLKTVQMTNTLAREAVDRDIDNGTLIARYQKEVQGIAPAPAATADSSISSASAKAAFNANDAHQAPAAAPTVQAQPPANRM